MTKHTSWTRQQLLVAFSLYCRLPFGKFHSKNPEIIVTALQINRTPSALAMKLSNLASLDEAITSTGRKGLQSASSTDKIMWDEMQNDWEKFAEEMSLATREIESKSLKQDEHYSYVGREKFAQTKVRIGQSFFRKAVLSAHNYKCCITGLSSPKLLVASHIIPWRNDESNRLNPRNGLSLSLLHDKAFDIGIITINEDMTVKVSEKELSKDSFYNTALKSYNGKPIILPDKFHPHSDFLAYHRECIFEKWDTKE